MQNSLIQANRSSKVKIPLYPDSVAISCWASQGTKYPWLVHAEQICLLNKYQSAKQPRVKYTDLSINLNKLLSLDVWTGGSPHAVSFRREEERSPRRSRLADALPRSLSTPWTSDCGVWWAPNSGSPQELGLAQQIRACWPAPALPLLHRYLWESARGGAGITLGLGGAGSGLMS